MDNSVQYAQEQFLRENWFATKFKAHQVTTFTLAFLLLYRFAITLLLYFNSKEAFYESYNLSIWFFIIGIPVIYFLQWVIVVWAVSKLPSQKLNDIFHEHPIAAILFFALYVTDLPYRLSTSDLGTGIWKVTNAFEIIAYYAFITFLWFLLICWISGKVLKKRRFQWNWYKIVINKMFVIIPILYKVILGLIVASFVFLALFSVISLFLGYSGQDLKSFSR